MDGAMVVWAGMHPNDMRPKEDFKVGCLVDCIDRPMLCGGKLLKIDADQRLGWVEWGSGKAGWWYLKDLVISGWPIQTQSRRTNAKELQGLQGKIISFDELEQLVGKAHENIQRVFLEAITQAQGGRRVA